MGEHGAGKSEVALSRALWLARKEVKVALADLDTVEPCYTLNSPLTRALEKVPNLSVLSNESERVFAGEVGNILAPRVRWVLVQNKNAVLDIGYGVDGFNVLRLLEGYQRYEGKLKLYIVQNFSRPATGTQEKAQEYLRTYPKLDGIINNTHLGDASTIELALEGEQKALALSEATGIPLLATVLWRRLADTFLAQIGAMAHHRSALSSLEPTSAPEAGNIDILSAQAEIEMEQEKIHSALREKFHAPVWLITRLMPFGFWG